MAATTHYVGQSAHLIADAQYKVEVKNAGTVPVWLGDAGVDSENGEKVTRGRTVTVDGQHVYARAYSADPATVTVRVLGDATPVDTQEVEDEPDPA